MADLPVDGIGEVADRFFAAIQRGDSAAVEAMWADDVLVWHSATGGTTTAPARCG